MRPIDLARSLEADLDDVLMTLLDLNGTRHIRSEFTRIGSVSILNEFAKKTGIKVKVVKAPEKAICCPTSSRRKRRILILYHSHLLDQRISRYDPILLLIVIFSVAGFFYEIN